MGGSTTMGRSGHAPCWDIRSALGHVTADTLILEAQFSFAPDTYMPGRGTAYGRCSEQPLRAWRGKHSAGGIPGTRHPALIETRVWTCTGRSFGRAVSDLLVIPASRNNMPWSRGFTRCARNDPTYGGHSEKRRSLPRRGIPTAMVFQTLPAGIMVRGSADSSLRFRMKDDGHSEKRRSLPRRGIPTAMVFQTLPAGIIVRGSADSSLRSEGLRHRIKKTLAESSYASGPMLQSG